MTHYTVNIPTPNLEQQLKDLRNNFLKDVDNKLYDMQLKYSTKLAIWAIDTEFKVIRYLESV